MMPFTSMLLSVVILGEHAQWQQWLGGIARDIRHDLHREKQCSRQVNRRDETIETENCA
jgi:hypothetical protein